MHSAHGITASEQEQARASAARVGWGGRGKRQQAAGSDGGSIVICDNVIPDPQKRPRTEDEPLDDDHIARVFEQSCPPPVYRSNVWCVCDMPAWSNHFATARSLSLVAMKEGHRVQRISPGLLIETLMLQPVVHAFLDRAEEHYKTMVLGQAQAGVAPSADAHYTKDTLFGIIGDSSIGPEEYERLTKRIGSGWLNDNIADFTLASACRAWEIFFQGGGLAHHLEWGVVVLNASIFPMMQARNTRGVDR